MNEAKRLQECVKMEIDESDVYIKFNSAPNLFDADDADVKRITLNRISVEEVISCIERVKIPNLISFPYLSTLGLFLKLIKFQKYDNQIFVKLHIVNTFV